MNKSELEAKNAVDGKCRRAPVNQVTTGFAFVPVILEHVIGVFFNQF